MARSLTEEAWLDYWFDPWLDHLLPQWSSSYWWWSTLSFLDYLFYHWFGQFFDRWFDHWYGHGFDRLFDQRPDRPVLQP